VPVGAQAVGEDVGVPAVRLVAGQPIALAQGLDRAARDHHDVETSAEEGLDDRPVRALDRHPGDVCSISNSSITVPTWSTTAIAWTSVAQSTPPKRNVSFSMSASSLIAQWGSTRWSKDASAGRSLIGALGRSALLPGGASWAAGPRRSHFGGRAASTTGDGPTVTRGASPSSVTRQWWSSEPYGEHGNRRAGFGSQFDSRRRRSDAAAPARNTCPLLSDDWFGPRSPRPRPGHVRPGLAGVRSLRDRPG
jgi:hypothetical protein